MNKGRLGLLTGTHAVNDLYQGQREALRVMGSESSGNFGQKNRLIIF